MKTLILFLLFSATALAQFPVTTVSNDVSVLAQQQGAIADLSRTFAPVTFTSRPKSTTAGVNWYTATPTVPAGRIFYVSDILVTADRACKVLINIWPDAYSYQGVVGQAGESYQPVLSFGSGGGSAKLTYNNLPFREFGSLNIGVYASDSGQRQPDVSVLTQGIQTNMNRLPKARNSVLWIGHSIGWTNMGNDPAGNPYPGDSLTFHRMFYRSIAAGKPFDPILGAFGGAVSNDLVKAVRSGRWNTIPNLRAILVDIGTNNASAGGAQANLDAFTADLKNIIIWRNAWYPGVALFFLGSPQTDVALRSSLPSYRSAMQAVATDATLGGAARKVYYYDQSLGVQLAANATTDIMYRYDAGTAGGIERAAGSRTHLSGAGHRVNEAYLWSQFGGLFLNLLN